MRMELSSRLSTMEARTPLCSRRIGDRFVKDCFLGCGPRWEIDGVFERWPGEWGI